MTAPRNSELTEESDETQGTYEVMSPGVTGEERAAADELTALSEDLHLYGDVPPEHRAAVAAALIEEYGDTDGAHHKQWLLNQVLLILTNGKDHLPDEGIAPLWPQSGSTSTGSFTPTPGAGRTVPSTTRRWTARWRRWRT